MEMSSKFGGLQMNADHDMDDAEVTEASQMLSALEQMGYTHDIATKAYEEIGKLSFESISQWREAINDGDKEKMYQIFGKAIIDAFSTGNKDTLGLAQSFVKAAQEGMKENKLEYKIPFSSSSINGIFNATVTSQLIKKAIRRHYDGVAAVLHPSRGMMQYVEFNGQKYRLQEFNDVIKADIQYGIKTKGWDEYLLQIPVQNLVTEAEFIYIDNNGNEQLVGNPYVKPINHNLNPVDFGDTLVVYDNNANPEIVKINNFDDYTLYRNLTSNPELSSTIFRLEIAPRDLRASDTLFTVEASDGFGGVVNKVASVYESNFSNILQYLVNGDLASNDLTSLMEELETKFGNAGSSVIGTDIKKEVGDIIWSQIYDFINNNQEYLGVRLHDNEIIDYNGNTVLLSDLIPSIKKLALKGQQNLLNQIAESDTVDFNGEK